MRKYNTLLVVFFTVLLMFLLTWILPITYLNGEFTSAARSQVGLFDLFAYPAYTFYNFIYVLVYILIIGGFYGVLNKTGAYRLLLDKIVKFIKGKELLFWILTVLGIATVVSFTGFTFEALIVLPFIAAIILLLGYDKLTVALTIVGSIAVGIIGTTFSSLVGGSFNDILTTKYTDLWIAKVALLLVCSGILILNIILHTRKIEKKKTIEANMYIPEKAKSGKIKLWPLITVLTIFVVVFIISTLSWTDAFGVTIFTTALEKIQECKIFGFNLFGKILGAVKAFGEWSHNDYMALVIIAVIVIKFVYRVKIVEAIENFGEGAKKFLYAGIVIMLSYTVLILTSNHPVLLTVLKPILTLTDGLNSVTLSFSTFISALCNSDFTYYQYGILTLSYVSSYITDTTVYPLCVLITQSMYGLAMLVAPTSAVLLFSLTTLDITYWEWLKKIWKLFVELLVVLIVTFIIIMLI